MHETDIFGVEYATMVYCFKDDDGTKLYSYLEPQAGTIPNFQDFSLGTRGESSPDGKIVFANADQQKNFCSFMTGVHSHNVEVSPLSDGTGLTNFSPADREWAKKNHPFILVESGFDWSAPAPTEIKKIDRGGTPLEIGQLGQGQN